MTITNNFFDRLAGNSGRSVWQNKINGEWVDTHGWNFISQPQLNQPGGSDFKMSFDQMRETITFNKLGLARNVGITGEAGFWHGVSYEISIERTNGEPIHHEMGHFLLKVKEDGETHDPTRGDIIRQATIPRANAMMTLGELRPGSVTDAVNQNNSSFYASRPQTNNAKIQAEIDHQFDLIKPLITRLGGPDFDQPLNWLQGILAQEPVGIDWVFEFRHDKQPSQMASGQRVVNPVSIGNLLSDFWIAQRIFEDGEQIDILQYAQKVNLIFHGIEWPHVALNTLVRQ